jgi:hypothetical protein
MGSFVQLKSSENTPFLEGGDFSFFDAPVVSGRNLSMESVEYEINPEPGIPNQFRIPYDGDLIKFVYLHLKFPRLVSRGETINEWDEFDIFDNVSFKRYSSEVNSISQNIDKGAIINSFLDFLDAGFPDKNLWEESIFDILSKKNDNVSGIVLSVSEYHRSISSVELTLDEEVKMIISFYVSLCYLIRNSLLCIIKVETSAIPITLQSPVYTDISTFVNYVYEIVNANTVKTYIKNNGLTYLVSKFEVALQALQTEQETNNVSNVSVTDGTREYNTFLFNKLVSRLTNRYLENKITQTYNFIIEESATREISLGYVNEVYSEFVDEGLILCLYNIYNKSISDFTTSVSYLEEYRKLYKAYFVDIINHVKEVYEVDLCGPGVPGVNISLSEVLSLVDDVESRIVNVIRRIAQTYKDLNVYNKIDLGPYADIQSIRSAFAEYLPTLEESIEMSFLRSVDSDLQEVAIENLVINIVDKYDIEYFKTYRIYNDNARVIIQLLRDEGMQLSDDQVKNIVTNLNNYNKWRDREFLSNISVLTNNVFQESWLAEFPFFQFENSYASIDMFEKYKNVVLFHSCMNPIFMEEMYHEYVFDRKQNCAKEYDMDTRIEAVFARDLTPFETEIVSTFTYYNIEYVDSRLASDLVEELRRVADTVDLNRKYRFFHILDFENYLEFARTNFEHSMFLYEQWRLKQKNKKAWKSLGTTTYKGVEMTRVELYHVSSMVSKISSTFGGNDAYDIYFTNLCFEYNSLFLEESDFLLGSDYEGNFVSLTTNTNFEQTYYRGRHVLGGTVWIQKVQISPRTSVDFYGRNSFMQKLTSCENNTDSPLSFTVDVRARSFIVRNNLFVKGKYLYKNVYLDVEDPYVISNDVHYDIEKDSLRREFVAEKNIFAYMEKMRWVNFNDFIKLQFRAPGRSKFSKITRNYVSDKRFGWKSSVVHDIINSIQFQVDDQIIETLVPENFDVIRELFYDKKKYHRIVPREFELSEYDKEGFDVYFPVPFWFNRSSETFYPLVSSTQTNTYINLDIGELRSLIHNEQACEISRKVGVSYVFEYAYLDDVSKMELLGKNHLFAVSVFNYQEKYSMENQSLELTMRDQVQDIFINFYDESGNRILDLDAVKNVSLKMNGRSYVSKMDCMYYSVLNAWDKKFKGVGRNTFSISFNLYPHAVQPSGHLNFDTINDAVLNFEFEARGSENFDDKVKKICISYRTYKYMHYISGQISLS